MKINKLFYVLVVFLFANQAVQAQQHPYDPIYEKGEMVIGLGIGVLPTLASPTIRSTTPPISLNVNYRIAKKASIGAFAAYGATSFNSDLPEHAVIPRSSESKQYMFGVRGAAHYDVNKTDFYGGLMLGYSYEETITNISQPDNDEIPTDPVLKNGKVLYTAFLGVNQRLTNKLGVFGEVGYGVSIFKFGVNFKL